MILFRNVQPGRRKAKQARKSKRKGSGVLPPRHLPNECVTLNVDASTNSGWAVFVRDKHRWHGEARDSDLHSIQTACSTTIGLARELGVPASLVLEKPYGGSVRDVASMGGAAKVWIACWVAAGGTRNRIHRVYTSTWRSKVLGRGWGCATRAQARPVEQDAASRIAGVADGSIGADAAPAICMGRWSAFSGEVWKNLPKKFREMSERRV